LYRTCPGTCAAADQAGLDTGGHERRTVEIRRRKATLDGYAIGAGMATPA
jgi:hypothetical protein